MQKLAYDGWISHVCYCHSLLDEQLAHWSFSLLLFCKWYYLPRRELFCSYRYLDLQWTLRCENSGKFPLSNLSRSETEPYFMSYANLSKILNYSNHYQCLFFFILCWRYKIKNWSIQVRLLYAKFDQTYTSDQDFRYH